VLQAVTTARLQQLFDNGTYSALSASIAIQAFSTEIKARVDANGGTGAFVAHVSAVVAAIGANTDVPDFGTSLPFGATTATISAGSSSYNFTTAVNVLGADKFSYEVGGNSTAGINQPDISYASFVASILGVTMPTGASIATGGAVVIGSGDTATVLAVGTSTPVAATAQADNFSFNVASAQATAANTQIAISGFDIAADKLTIDTATALGAVKLSALSGVDGISVLINRITAETVINFDVDANGDLITLTLVGVTDPALVNVAIV
jgi:hypothetical protein